MPRTLDDHEVRELAAAHERARRDVTPIDPLTRQYPDATLEDAYAVQGAWLDLRVAEGAVVGGHKIGLTSRAMQQAMRIDEPDFGFLLDDMFIAPGATVVAADHLDPKIEVEFAFVLAAPLGARPVTADDVYAATARIAPALELIDARSHRVHPDDGRTRTVIDTIADNAADAGIVVGDGSVAVEDARRGALRWAGAILRRNGVVEETGLGAGVLDDPVHGVVWLVNRLHGLGIELAAGETILAGSFTRPVDVRAGDRFEVDFGPLGEITLDVV